ncbi:MAG: hypothetical protein ACHQO8_05300, partial [Vicinamibacterales bacterium]
MVRAMLRGLSGILLAAGAALWSSGHSDGATPAALSSSSTVDTGPLVFRSSPIAPGAIKWIVPLGNLNPPDHTTPTDHIYFYFADPDAG